MFSGPERADRPVVRRADCSWRGWTGGNIILPPLNVCLPCFVVFLMFFFFYSGGGQGPCRGAFVGPPAAWGICAGWSADGDHWDPSVRASRCCSLLLHNRGPSGRLWKHSGSVYFEETKPANTGKNPGSGSNIKMSISACLFKPG